MKRIHLTLTALAPLAIGQRKPGGSVSEAMDYIPGTVIRGAIAAALLKQAPEPPQAGDDFHRLFVDETAAIFHNAYPTIYKVGKDNYANSNTEVQVLPATALSAKTDSGFKPDKAGVFDSLIDSFCAREQGHFYEPNDLQTNPVESYSGFYSQDGQEYRSHTVSKRLLTRVGINRRRATAQEDILYSLEVLNESQGKQAPVQTVYQSTILIRDDHELADQLLSFLQHYCNAIRLGGSASRGLGLVELKATSEEIDSQTKLLKQRVEDFNSKLAARWQLWNVLGQATSNPMAGRTFFTLDLQADAILTEHWRRTMVISEAMLSQRMGIDISDLKLHIAYSSYDYRSGWNAAWGLPKDVELVTKMGSVFLFSIPDERRDDCYGQWADLEWQGVGERASEGYGQVKVCHEFHQVMRENPA